MKVLRPLMPTASPTGSQPAPEAARSLSISRSESTTTPEASARGFLVNRTTQGLRTSDRSFAAQGVRDPTPFDAPPTLEAKAQAQSLGFFLGRGVSGQCMGSSRCAAASRMRAVPRIVAGAACQVFARAGLAKPQ